VAADREERKHVLGFPVGPDPHPRVAPAQRVAGVPSGWFGPVDVAWLRAVLHPVRSVGQWRRRRRLGPYMDEAPASEDGGGTTST
jgi:hypothetical protein